MAIYSGKDEYNVDIIAGDAMTRVMISEIYDQLFPTPIGEVKIMSSHVDTNIFFSSINVEGSVVFRLKPDMPFDGWVRADGTKYSAQDFPDAGLEYGLNGPTGNQWFQVPNMQSSAFFKTNNAVQSDFSIIQQNTALPAHSHSLTNSFGIQTTLTIKNGFVFTATPNYGSKGRTQVYYTHPSDFDNAGKSCANTQYEATFQIRNNPAESKWPSKAGRAGQTLMQKYGCQNDEDLVAKYNMWKDEWSKRYVVPCLHSGISTTSPKASSQIPFPIDMTLKINDFSAMFANGETETPTISQGVNALQLDQGVFEPSSVQLPFMIYIGKRV